LWFSPFDASFGVFPCIPPHPIANEALLQTLSSHFALALRITLLRRNTDREKR
jgi:hypothetical protein